MKNSIHLGPIPFPATARRRSFFQRELLGDLADGQALLHIRIEDSAHHGRFVVSDLYVRCHAVTARDAHITERNLPSNNLAAPGPVELATPIPFGDLRPLKLGHSSGDLVHEFRKRIVCGPTLQEDGLHSESFQLFQN